MKLLIKIEAENKETLKHLAINTVYNEQSVVIKQTLKTKIKRKWKIEQN